MERLVTMEIPYFTGANLRIRRQVREGDYVRIGEIICTVEFEALGVGSAELDIEADHSGRITWLTEDRAFVNFGQEFAKIDS